MKIICQVAPWSKNFLNDIAKSIEGENNIKDISGFKKLDNTNLMTYKEKEFQKLEAGKEYTASPAELNEIEEIINRCRLLRNIDKSNAAMHIVALQKSIGMVYNEEKPDILIAELIDSYFQDVIIREAVKRKIKCYTFVQNFINGYSRMTLRGELNICSNPSDREIERAIKKITDKNYKPNYVIKKNKNILVTQLTAMLGNIARVAYFYTKRLTSGEKYNYHYWTSSLSIHKINLHFLPRTIKSNKNWKQIVENANLKVVFMPLQYSPEATIDYWCENTAHVNYEESISKYIAKLSKDFIVLIKEHPGVVGHRNPKFYDKIIDANNENIVVCPTNENSNECLLKSNAAFIYTGSVGFESAINGVPVITPETPYFVNGRFFKKINYETDNKEIINYIIDIEKKEIGKDEQYNMMRYLLKGLIEARVILDGSYNRNIITERNNAIKLGKIIQNSIK